jgi:hypothetical protein
MSFFDRSSSSEWDKLAFSKEAVFDFAYCLLDVDTAVTRVCATDTSHAQVTWTNV